MDVNEEGKYIFEKYISSYWEKDDRKAFLLKYISDENNQKWAGFVLIDKDFFVHKDYDYAIAEFFVMYKYRRKGVGKWMASKIFDMFKGKWELGCNPKNLTSCEFWKYVIKDYTKENYELKVNAPEHKYIDG